MSQETTTSVAILLAFVGAAIGYTQAGIAWGIGGFVAGLLITIIVSTILDCKQDRASQEREEAKSVERAAQSKALIDELRESGQFDDTFAHRATVEHWPPVLLQQFMSGELSFEECSCIWAGRIQPGLTQSAIESMVGHPDNEKILALKGKSKQIWTYYAKPDVRRGLLLKATFEEGVLTEYIASDEDGLLDRLQLNRVTRYGLPASEYLAHLKQKSQRF